MKCLIVVANPNSSGFTYQLVDKFKAGLESQGHTHETIELFQEHYIESTTRHAASMDETYKEKILEADAICFAFPWWFEMPPYPLAAFLQRIFTDGFAYSYADGVKTMIIKKPVQVLICMGQRKEYNIRSLRDGLDYVGLRIERELVCTNVGPRLEPEMAARHLESAEICGELLFTPK